MFESIYTKSSIISVPIRRIHLNLITVTMQAEEKIVIHYFTVFVSLLLPSSDLQTTFSALVFELPQSVLSS